MVEEFGVVVAGLLQANWSPQQIATLLPDLCPEREVGCVSHETNYQSLFVQSREKLRRELIRQVHRVHGSKAPRMDRRTWPAAGCVKGSGQSLG